MQPPQIDLGLEIYIPKKNIIKTRCWPSNGWRYIWDVVSKNKVQGANLSKNKCAYRYIGMHEDIYIYLNIYMLRPTWMFMDTHVHEKSDLSMKLHSTIS